jgi:hypothetical protein
LVIENPLVDKRNTILCGRYQSFKMGILTKAPSSLQRQDFGNLRGRDAKNEKAGKSAPAAKDNGEGRAAR